MFIDKVIVGSVSQEFFHLSWKPKMHYRVNRIPPVPTLCHMNPEITFPFPFRKIYFNINFPSKLKSCKLSFPLRLSNQNFLRIYHQHMIPTCLTYFTLLDFIILIICGREYKNNYEALHHAVFSASCYIPSYI